MSGQNGSAHTGVVMGYEILKGRTYRYVAEKPESCKDCLYRVVSTDVMWVPTYTTGILVVGLDGIDKGRLFSMTAYYFAMRFKLVEEETQSEPEPTPTPETAQNAVEPVPERRIGHVPESWRSGV